MEANSYAHVTQKVVKCFIEKDLICRHGSPEKIVIDNAQNFNGKIITELCVKWKIKHSNSSSYRPKMNGVLEAANKNIKKIIQKMVVTYKVGMRCFLCSACISYSNKDIHWSYTLLISIWDGGGDAFGSRNYISESTNRI